VSFFLITIVFTGGDFVLKIPQGGQGNQARAYYAPQMKQNLQSLASPGFDFFMNKKQKASRVSRMINDMTLDEKIGQLLIVGIDGHHLNPSTKRLIQSYHVGGVILYGNNIATVRQTVQLLNDLKAFNEKSGNPTPLFVSVDQEGGSVARLPDSVKNLPANAKIGKVADRGFSTKVGKLLGHELKIFGFNMDFAPVLDVNSHPKNSVIGSRSFGSDAGLVSRLGTATMEGISSENVIPVIKHFPGYGAVKVDAHTDLPKVSADLKRLSEVEWVPFQNAIKHGADAVMVTHIVLTKFDRKYPASMSPVVIGNLLRDRLNFKGVVITDDLTMGAVTDHFGVGQAAVQAVKAGADIVLVGHRYENEKRAFEAIKKAVESGEISEKRINKKIRRILLLKQKYKLSNDRSGPVNTGRLNQEIRTIWQVISS
jgi:beta-N-acetylhexosaminidase